MREAGSDLVEAYLQIALADGGRADDPRLAALLGLMTGAELGGLKQRFLAAYVATLPPGLADAPVTDIAELYLALVTHGARPDDPRLVVLGALMTGEERERAKQGIAELWLQAEPRPARVN